MDDHALTRMLVREMLIRTDCTVDSVAHAEEGLHLVRLHRYDLAILDYRLPGMNGLAAAEAMRKASPPSAHFPLLLLTGEANLENSPEYIKADITKRLLKPFTMADLLEAVSNLMGGTKARAEHVAHSSAAVRQLQQVVDDAGISIAQRSLLVRRFCNEHKPNAPADRRPKGDAALWTHVDTDHLLSISGDMGLLSNYLVERVVAAS